MPPTRRNTEAKMNPPFIINEDQAHSAIRTGEFGRDVVASNTVVIVVMTQDWCPQWIYMSTWIPALQSESGVDIYELIYNREEYFHDFLRLKEGLWGNYAIPYLRYYRAGELVAVSNFVGKRRLKRLAGIHGRAT